MKKYKIIKTEILDFHYLDSDTWIDQFTLFDKKLNLLGYFDSLEEVTNFIKKDLEKRRR